jgi:pimeloyl-ACP methyl ester carboxylesterase
MKKFRVLMVCVSLCFSIGFIFSPGQADAKTHDLVLVHGLLNMHAWSDNFLDACLSVYGSGNVYAVYLDGTTAVTTRSVRGKILYVAGGDNDEAGTDYVENQALYMENLIDLLQSNYGLSSSFSIIAHSMGGLVARAYAVENPGKAAGIVCLGTPNNGGKLFVNNWDEWIMIFMGAENAASNADPDWIQGYFNVEYPVSAIEFADGGRLYTIRGITNITTCGVIPLICELRMGYLELYAMGHPNKDGLSHAETVPIKGGVHIRDFFNCSHLDLVLRTDVAYAALNVLP